MKRIIFIAAALALTSAASGQKKWTLRECIDYAVENNIEIKQTALNVENAAIELNTAQHSRLPNLNAGLNQNFSFGRSQVDVGGESPQMRNTQTSPLIFLSKYLLLACENYTL